MSQNDLLRIPCGDTAVSLALRTAIATLDPHLANVVYRRVVVRESVADIARDLGQPEATIRADVDRGLANLRGLLSE